MISISKQAWNTVSLIKNQLFRNRGQSCYDIQLLLYVKRNHLNGFTLMP